MGKESLKNCLLREVSMPNEDVELVLSKFRQESLKKGDFMVHSGDRCHHMYFILKGHFRIYNLAKDEEVTLWIAGPGQFLTDLSSFVYDEPGQWDIQALSDAQVLDINRADHHKLLETCPKWMEFDNKLLSNAFKMLEHRMFSHLHLSAKERYEMLLQTQADLINHVPLIHVASMLGMKPETLSRMRKQIS